jgi:glycosyltransferase involved in cell wall biosynthesis
LQNCSVVENGVALPPIAEKKPREDFALVMGRICPEKNAHAALEAGTLARTRVLLAGQAFPYREHQQYLRQKIEPVLQSQKSDLKHALLGPLSSSRKQELLAQAKCLLHPTLAPETSSLSAMEALAAGTPVIAYRSGALPEIVEHGLTGFLVDGVEEMAEAIRKVHTITSEACRRAAERRFSKERMVRGYFERYGALLHHSSERRDA